MTLSIFEAITLSIAVLGAALGLINTWASLSENKVKIVVVPKNAFPVGNDSDNFEFCVEVVNRSAFPVTISEVGFFYRGTKKRSILIKPIISDGSSIPKRLEPRSAVSFYSGKPQQFVNGKRIKCAFVKTDCGTVQKGKSPSLRQLANAT